MPASEIPQGKFRDIARLLLGVEPEYLFDLPSITWLWRWYLISLFGILGGSFAIVLLCVGLFKFASRLVASREVKAFAWLERIETWAFWILAFVLGALGTTVISHWTQEFIFTWHICLYVAWHVAIANLSKRTESRKHLQRVQSIGALLFFLTTCLAYFLLCRRLSLLFEWVFLGGFFAAVPFNLLSKNLIRPCDKWTGDASFCGNDRTGWLSRNRWTKTWQFLLTGLGFSAFYWSSVAILYFR